MDRDLQRELQRKREQAIGFYKEWEYVGKEVMIPGRQGEIRTLFYYPDEMRQEMPVFFDIHGGGHILHKAEADQPFCRKISKELNILVVSIDYHLAPEYQWPTQVYEVYDVVHYMFQNAEQFCIHPQKMGIGGHSAGGNLAAVTALMAKDTGDFELRCQVLDYPETDLVKEPKDKFIGKARYMVEELEFFNQCYVNKEEVESPYFSPAYAEINQMKGLPPAIMVLCEEDILYQEGLDYSIKLIKAGVETTVRMFPEVRHGFTVDDYYTKEAHIAHEFMIAAMRKYLN